jgi:hypothetical protein
VLIKSEYSDRGNPFPSLDEFTGITPRRQSMAADEMSRNLAMWDAAWAANGALVQQADIEKERVNGG